MQQHIILYGDFQCTVQCCLLKHSPATLPMSCSTSRCSCCRPAHSGGSVVPGDAGPLMVSTLRDDRLDKVPGQLLWVPAVPEVWPSSCSSCRALRPASAVARPVPKISAGPVLLMAA